MGKKRFHAYFRRFEISVTSFDVASEARINNVIQPLSHADQRYTENLFEEEALIAAERHSDTTEH